MYHLRAVSGSHHYDNVGSKQTGYTQHSEYVPENRSISSPYQTSGDVGRGEREGRGEGRGEGRRSREGGEKRREVKRVELPPVLPPTTPIEDSVSDDEGSLVCMVAYVLCDHTHFLLQFPRWRRAVQVLWRCLPRELYSSAPGVTSDL